MKYRLLILAITTLGSHITWGQALKKEYQAQIVTFIECLKNNPSCVILEIKQEVVCQDKTYHL